MTLYDRLASTPEGARALAIARLKNECMGALWEALQEAQSKPDANARKLAAYVRGVNRLCKKEGKKLTIDALAACLHGMGKELMITIVPAGEPRRIAEQEMAEMANRQNADKGPKNQGAKNGRELGGDE